MLVEWSVVEVVPLDPEVPSDVIADVCNPPPLPGSERPPLVSAAPQSSGRSVPAPSLEWHQFACLMHCKPHERHDLLAAVPKPTHQPWTVERPTMR